ncbi:hypothetical protein BIFGAL_03441 [Bifidobacterium gallicum DSM 20093 = LMG 11596]|uniref:Uncharacterized protein n=1 Tax=Bifidobacterium gallicum DSM 20093 = LMG 11596 TaxID=561180 RepID=D1NUC0_9BIFI|nr:hypothetical protein BIFGAL_03441 [Bifidobacterium gallicum DSM 20093 = LMG 11596]
MVSKTTLPNPNRVSPDQCGQQNYTFHSQTAPPLTSLVSKTAFSVPKARLS